MKTPHLYNRLYDRQANFPLDISLSKPPERLSDLLIYGWEMINDKFNFPENVKRLKLDIGLSQCAPHSCEWLLKNNDVGIIGIEASPICQTQLIYGGNSNSYVNSLYLHIDKICKFTGYISEVYLKQELLGLDLTKRENIEEIPAGTFIMNGNKYHVSSLPVYNDLRNFRLYPIVQEVNGIDGRYNLLGAAVDNVDSIVMQEFYSSYPAIGCSSLVKGMIEANERPAGNTADTRNVVNKIFKVPSLPLDMVLEHVDWHRFPFVESIKIDVEGKDLEVLKSCKKHMDKVVYFRAEAYDDENIVYGIKKRDMVEYMQANNFELIDEEDGDYGFINKKYKKLAKEQGLTYR